LKSLTDGEVAEGIYKVFMPSRIYTTYMNVYHINSPDVAPAISCWFGKTNCAQQAVYYIAGFLFNENKF